MLGHSGVIFIAINAQQSATKTHRAQRICQGQQRPGVLLRAGGGHGWALACAGRPRPVDQAKVVLSF